MKTLVKIEEIRQLIYTLRGVQVMIDSDLVELYRIEAKALNQAVRRNIERFPIEFMFRLTAEEFDSLRSQIVTSNQRGGRRYLPYAFTEQGVAMLSAVLRSEIAVIEEIRPLSQQYAFFRDVCRSLIRNSLWNCAGKS